MENYIKAVLYAYPYLQETTRAYQAHIKTQALFSCDGKMGVEKLAEYLAEEILRKRRLLWVKETVEGVLDACNGWERAMVEVLFFGRKCARKLLIEKYQDRAQTWPIGDAVYVGNIKRRCFKKWSTGCRTQG